MNPDGIVGTLLMNLSKAHGSVNHELIIAKWAACGLNEGSLWLIENYLSNRKTAGKNRFFPKRITRNYSGCPSRVNIRAYFI